VSRWELGCGGVLTGSSVRVVDGLLDLGYFESVGVARKSHNDRDQDYQLRVSHQNFPGREDCKARGPFVYTNLPVSSVLKVFLSVKFVSSVLEHRGDSLSFL